MKAIILVAGVGSKTTQPTNLQPKGLLTLADKPILGHIIDDLMQAGIDNFVFVIGSLGYKVQQYVRMRYKKRIKAEFIIQEPRLGSAHAVWTARQFFSNEPEVLLIFGDTISSLDTKKFIRNKTSTVGVTKVDKPSAFGIVEINKKGEVSKFSEKPKIPKSNLALVGLYKIRNVSLLLEAIGQNIENKKQTQGEYHLTDALTEMLKAGEVFETVEVNHWYDCSCKETLLEANEVMLKQEKFEIVQPEKYHNTILIPPVSIGENTKISNSIIGPYVSIGSNTTINSCIVQTSIVCSNANLLNIILRKTVIGNDTNVKGAFRSLYVSDESSVDMQKD
jgi:glucose-1-phosphate thymidylyltransferase